MNKRQFMLAKAKEEWEGSDEFTRDGILTELRYSLKWSDSKFADLPASCRSRIASFCDYMLGYSEDWKELQEQKVIA